MHIVAFIVFGLAVAALVTGSVWYIPRRVAAILRADNERRERENAARVAELAASAVKPLIEALRPGVRDLGTCLSSLQSLQRTMTANELGQQAAARRIDQQVLNSSKLVADARDLLRDARLLGEAAQSAEPQALAAECQSGTTASGAGRDERATLKMRVFTLPATDDENTRPLGGHSPGDRATADEVTRARREDADAGSRTMEKKSA